MGAHCWRALTFVHWEIEPAHLRALVPRGLEIDTCDGKAYVGIVAFTMHGVRPLRLLPPCPGASAFHETNVRTYVHREGREPGIWFFSLDAASRLATRVGRRFFHLPYAFADMAIERDDARVSYRSTRRWPAPVPATLDLRVELGAARPAAAPESLIYFLVERYYLYAQRRDGALLQGQVHHPSYPLREARLVHVAETLIAAAGLQRLGPRSAPVLFSEGVDVDVYPFVEVA